MNMSIRSEMSLIIGQVIPDQWVLSALEIEEFNFSSLLVFNYLSSLLTCTA